MRSLFDPNYPLTSNRGAFFPPVSDWIDTRVLPAGVMERHTVPTDATFVVFSATDQFFAKFGSAAVLVAVPAADILDGTAGMLNPAGRSLFLPSGSGTFSHIALIAPAACTVTLEFYKV